MPAADDPLWTAPDLMSANPSLLGRLLDLRLQAGVSILHRRLDVPGFLDDGAASAESEQQAVGQDTASPLPFEIEFGPQLLPVRGADDDQGEPQEGNGGQYVHEAETQVDNETNPKDEKAIDEAQRLRPTNRWATTRAPTCEAILVARAKA